MSALPATHFACALVFALASVALGACGRTSLHRSDVHPSPFACAQELLAGGVSRATSDSSGLVSQRALGALGPRLWIDSVGNRFAVYRDDIPTGRGEAVLRVFSATDATQAPSLELSDSAGDSAAPDIAGRDQLVSVVWVERQGTVRALLARISSDGGDTFSPVVRVSTSVNPDAQPRVAVDAQDRVVVVWDGPSDSADGSRPLFGARSNPGGGRFSDPVTLAKIQGLGEVALAIASSQVFVAWAEARTIEGGHVVELVHSDESGEVFSSPSEVRGETFTGPALLADDTAGLLLLWASGTTTTGSPQSLGVVLSRSLDGGDSFEDLGTLDEGPGSNLQLAGNPAGELWAAWQSCPVSGSCETQMSHLKNHATAPFARGVIHPDVLAGSQLKVCALGVSSSDLDVMWTGRPGWFADVFSSTLDPGKAEAEVIAAGLSPLTHHAEISSAEVGADASMPVLALGTGQSLWAAWGQEANAIPSAASGIFLAASQDSGRTFQPPRRVGDNAPTVDFACQKVAGMPTVPLTPAHVSLAVRGSDVAVAWADEVADPTWSGACWLGTPADIFVSRSSDGGMAFSEPVNVSRSVGASTNPVLRFDAHGALVLLWEELVAGRDSGCEYTNRSQIFSARAEGGQAFSLAMSLSDVVHPGFCGNTENPILAVAGDKIYAAWIAESALGSGTRRVISVRSQDGGATFSAERSALDVPYSTWPVGALAAQAAEPASLWLGLRISDALALVQSQDSGDTFSPLLEIARSPGSSGVALGFGGLAGGGTLWGAWSIRSASGDPGEIGLLALTGVASAPDPMNISNNDGNSDWPHVIGVEPNHALVAWEDDTPFPGVRAVLVGCR